MRDKLENAPVGCRFGFSVRAPQGLGNLAVAFEKSELNLYTYRSGNSLKAILRSTDTGPIDLDMDSSDTDYLWGEGLIASEFAESKEIVEELGRMFASCGYPHRILLDNEGETKTHGVEHEWNDQCERESRT